MRAKSGIAVLVPVGDDDERVGARRARRSSIGANAIRSPRRRARLVHRGRDRARRPSRRRASSASMSVSAGASRMSSVSALNASPQTAIRAPRERRRRARARASRTGGASGGRSPPRPPRARQHRRADVVAPCARAPSRPWGSTSRRSPGPGKRNAGPMRASLPMPLRTRSTFGADLLAQVGDLVHERDARREHRVGRVLGHLRRRDVHEEDRLAGAHERRVQLGHHARARSRSRRRARRGRAS